MMLELDVHGLTVDEALRTFVASYNRRFRSGSRESIRVIHGYGSSGEGGKIQRQFRKYLESKPSQLTWTAGENFENNPGVTIVHVKSLLPDVQNQLEGDILAFCSIPRTESKIAGQFRKHTAREIKEAVRSLVRAGLVKSALKNGHETYVDGASG